MEDMRMDAVCSIRGGARGIADTVGFQLVPRSSERRHAFFSKACSYFLIENWRFVLTNKTFSFKIKL